MSERKPRKRFYFLTEEARVLVVKLTPEPVVKVSAVETGDLAPDAPLSASEAGVLTAAQAFCRENALTMKETRPYRLEEAEPPRGSTFMTTNAGSVGQIIVIDTFHGKLEL